MRYPIQINVPICPKCQGALKKSHKLYTHDYFCMNCRAFYKVVEQGITDRELICEENV